MVSKIDIRQLARNWESYLEIPGKVTRLADIVSAPIKMIDAKMGPIFRGESQIYPEPLTPSLFRRKFKDLEALSKYEFEQIREAQLECSNKSVGDRFINAFAPLMHPDDLNWLFFARHFSKDTRLLDITRNPLVALYFATAETDIRQDGVVYLLQSSSYRPIQEKYNDEFDKHDFPKVPISYQALLSPDFDPRITEDIPYLTFPELPQERIIAQQGGFFFWKNPEATLLDMRQVYPIIIDANSKANIRRELEGFGISDATLFPNFQSSP